MISSMCFVVLITFFSYLTKIDKFKTKQIAPNIKTVLICLGIGFILGMYDGFYGPGTGTFLLLVFCNLAKMDLRTASGNVKLVNVASGTSALITSAMAGKVIAPIGLIATVFSIVGHYLGAGMTLKNGAKAVRPVIFIVLALLAVKVVLELL